MIALSRPYILWIVVAQVIRFLRHSEVCMVHLPLQRADPGGATGRCPPPPPGSFRWPSPATRKYSTLCHPQNTNRSYRITSGRCRRAPLVPVLRRSAPTRTLHTPAPQVPASAAAEPDQVADEVPRAIAPAVRHLAACHPIHAFHAFACSCQSPT